MIIQPLDWLSEAELNANITTDSGRRKLRHITGGLLSGYRATNFFNTLFNIIYCR